MFSQNFVEMETVEEEEVCGTPTMTSNRMRIFIIICQMLKLKQECSLLLMWSVW
jgi:hypothetical protein